MKKIRITEDDVSYCQGLGRMLIDEGARPITFEVADDFDINSYEGIALVEESDPFLPAKGFEAKFPEVVAWLNNYRGNFEFYLSLKAQFAYKGMLSEKQIASVQKAIARDKANGIPTPVGEVREFDLKPGTVLMLTKFISTKIAEQAGHARAHRVVEVISVEGETPKAYRAKVKLSAKRTSHCGICGLTLENAASIAAGIGPICAENYGLDYSDKALGLLQKIFDTTLEVVTWIPKKSIKERIEPAA